MISMYWVLPEWSMILRARTIRIRATVRAAEHPAEKPVKQLYVMWRLFRTMNTWSSQTNGDHVIISHEVYQHRKSGEKYTLHIKISFFFFLYILCKTHTNYWFTHGKCNPMPFSLRLWSQDSHSYISIWVGKMLNEYIFYPLHKPSDLQGKMIHKEKQLKAFHICIQNDDAKA